MNLLYLKYAVEVAACGSINKAAEKLYIGQPNLSRAIKELESSLGVTIFGRSSKGMEITPDGEIFLGYAKSILKQVDAVEGLFKSGRSALRFSLAAPAASYIGEAFASFVGLIKQDGEARIRYRECGETDAVRRVLQDDFRLGIIRYPAAHDRYYKSLLEDKQLDYELICEFRYLLIFSKNSPLAGKERIYTSDLRELTMITHADPAQPFSLPDQKKDESDGEPSRSIVVYERASQFSILEKDPTTYMWVSPVPRETLGKYGLETRECEDDRRLFKDVMIHETDYRLAEPDKLFISELCRVKREVFDENRK